MIKMRALQRHYVIAEKHEYKPGEEFNVATEREANELVRFKRADRVEITKTEPTPGEKRHYGRRDMKPEA